MDIPPTPTDLARDKALRFMDPYLDEFLPKAIDKMIDSLQRPLTENNYVR